MCRAHVCNTHYHNSNLIWRTVSCRVDEVIPSDPMLCPHPRDVILYARSSYYYDNMFIICLFSDIPSDFKTCFGLLSRKIAGTFAIEIRFLTSCQHFFRLWFHACNLPFVTSPQKQVTNVSLVLKDSDMDSENLSSFIWLSVSNGQKTDSSKVVSVIGI